MDLRNTETKRDSATSDETSVEVAAAAEMTRRLEELPDGIRAADGRIQNEPTADGASATAHSGENEIIQSFSKSLKRSFSIVESKPETKQDFQKRFDAQLTALTDSTRELLTSAELAVSDTNATFLPIFGPERGVNVSLEFLKSEMSLEDRHIHKLVGPSFYQKYIKDEESIFNLDDDLPEWLDDRVYLIRESLPGFSVEVVLRRAKGKGIESAEVGLLVERSSVEASSAEVKKVLESSKESQVVDNVDEVVPIAQRLRSEIIEDLGRRGLAHESIAGEFDYEQYFKDAVDIEAFVNEVTAQLEALKNEDPSKCNFDSKGNLNLGTFELAKYTLQAPTDSTGVISNLLFGSAVIYGVYITITTGAHLGSTLVWGLGVPLMVSATGVFVAALLREFELSPLRHGEDSLHLENLKKALLEKGITCDITVDLDKKDNKTWTVAAQLKVPPVSEED